ncbi:MAG: lipid-A-disaccharide synthase N-terminal domain-containing protein [Gloeobacteraceae cyanobacterium ES-bin-144]|nr:lipid-A-disaccharide synthase N-terminal domain-containing protein [Verrucomicrobiales bacterium]
MNETIFQGILFGKILVITPCKIIGYVGVALFGTRWIVQMIASKKSGRVTMPTLFWLMSVVGSFCLLFYFSFGKNDSVGLLSNIFPAFVSCYNLVLDLKSGRKKSSDVLIE